MTEYLSERASAELLALEAKLSAFMPYRQAVAIAQIFARTGRLSHVAVRNRVLRTGA